MKFLYTDIDGILSLGSEIKNHQTRWGILQKFNPGAVKVYNKILLKTDALPIISSDWSTHFSLIQLQEIFIEWANISVAPIDVTIHSKFKTLQQLEEFRAKEILEHVNIHKPATWVAIDDLDLSKWIDEEHFVHLPRFYEGIKQSGKANKIIKLLNKNE